MPCSQKRSRGHFRKDGPAFCAEDWHPAILGRRLGSQLVTVSSGIFLAQSPYRCFCQVLLSNHHGEHYCVKLSFRWPLKGSMRNQLLACSVTSFTCLPSSYHMDPKKKRLKKGEPWSLHTLNKETLSYSVKWNFAIEEILWAQEHDKTNEDNLGERCKKN